MSHKLQVYTDGAWVEPSPLNDLDAIDPANAEAFAQIALGAEADVDKAVAAAKRASTTFSLNSREELLASQCVSASILATPP